MTRFFGQIGFVKQTEIRPGVWDESAIERDYYGDVLRNNYRWDKSEQVNDNLNISNSISIVADSFILDNAYALKYIRWLGARWTITSFEIQQPRIILSIGGLYNGPEPERGASRDPVRHPGV